MKQKLSIWLLYIGGSILFLLVPFLTGPDHIPGSGVFLGYRRWDEFIQFVLLLIFFYLNYFILVPKLYFRQKYFLYALIILSAMIIIPWLSHSLFPGTPPPFDRPGPDFSGRRAIPPGEMMKPGLFTRVNHNVFLFLAVAFSSLLLRINNRWKKAEQEMLTSRLSYLREQVNPHFLFNTLNSIYLLALEKSDEAPQAVLKLSEMMRYVMNDTIKEKVPLQNEITYIENYIELQHLRFGNSLPVEYNVEGVITNKFIAPLLLITFIENAFKHGVNAAEQNEINIRINITEKSHLKMTVSNKKVKVYHEKTERSGIGLQNTRNRLEILYPGKHNLAITENDNEFNVSLEIDLG
jgi:hypothetical protein